MYIVMMTLLYTFSHKIIWFYFVLSWLLVTFAKEKRLRHKKEKYELNC